MNRGSKRLPRNLVLRTSRFNEAPIHESGKCSGSGARKRTAPGLQ